MTTLIKRYANRKLYNTKTSRYITLKGIAKLIEEGEDVRVVDNETGEDITSVALSQILVDNERAHQAVPGSVLSEILQRGGDVLYNALRRRVGDAGEGIGELQRSVRRFIHPREGEFIAFAPPDLERLVQGAMERVLKLLDLPTRSDIRGLEQKLERVATALERLEVRRPPAAPEPETRRDASPPGGSHEERTSHRPGDPPGNDAA